MLRSKCLIKIANFRYFSSHKIIPFYFKTVLILIRISSSTHLISLCTGKNVFVCTHIKGKEKHIAY